MNLFEIITGRYFIELLGAAVRFGFGWIVSKFKKSKPVKFSEYWNEKKGGLYERMETEAANRIAGGFFFAAIIVVMVIFLI